VRINFAHSFLGDSLLNRCLYSRNYERITGTWFTHFFRWTEPHLLVTVNLVILLLLPLIFLVRPDDSYIKISRLYNVSRLSILTFFHRVAYIYFIFCPLSLLIDQKPPCRQNYASDKFLKLNYFPSPRFASFTITVLYFYSLACASRLKYTFLFIVFIIVAGVHNIFAGDLSVAQMIVTFSLAYIIHFYSQRVPFWFLHVENIVLPVIFIILFIIKKDTFFENSHAIGRTITTLSLWISDFYMLGRYHCTRAGFVSVGRPIDLEYETDTKTSVYIDILSSDEENVFSMNLKKDLIDSAVSMVYYIIGLVIRHYLTGEIKASASGLI
jgi:hypothetical protein